MMNSSVEFSVVIPTYNRSDLLEVALKSLCDQTASRDVYEIIVVDNNSKDDTRAVTAKYESFGNVRYVLETEQGHSAARNRGWKEARAAYIGYVDDDCKMPSGWVDAALEIIHTVAPLCFGGPYLAFYLNEKPKWFKDSYGSHVQAEEAQFLKPDKYLSGGNIVFGKHVLQKFNGFSTNFGMVGKKIGYADETELLLRLRAEYGPDILYFSPSIFVYHLVRPEKMTWKQILKSNWAMGRHVQRMTLSKAPKSGRPLVATLFIHLIRMVLIPLKIIVRIATMWNRDRTKYPYAQNYFYEVIMWYVREMAASYELITTLFEAHGNAARGQ